MSSIDFNNTVRGEMFDQCSRLLKSNIAFEEIKFKIFVPHSDVRYITRQFRIKNSQPVCIVGPITSSEKKSQKKQKLKRNCHGRKSVQRTLIAIW